MTIPPEPNSHAALLDRLFGDEKPAPDLVRCALEEIGREHEEKWAEEKRRCEEQDRDEKQRRPNKFNFVD